MLLLTSCSLFVQTERVEIANPEPLLRPEVARLASGAELRLGGERWTFEGVEDSQAVLLKGKDTSRVPVGELAGGEFILKAKRLSGKGCLLGGLTGLAAGGTAGCLFYQSVSSSTDEQGGEGEGWAALGAAIAYAIAVLIVLVVAAIVGVAMALVGVLAGATCGAGCLGYEQVKKLKLRAQKLREALGKK